MNSPAKDLSDILDSSAHNLGVFGTDLFVSKMPDKPDACVCLYDSGGFAPASGYVYDKPTVQAIIRGVAGSYTNTYNKAEQIKKALHDLHGEEWGASRYIGIWAMSDILFLGYDELDRPSFSVNFRIHRTDI